MKSRLSIPFIVASLLVMLMSVGHAQTAFVFAGANDNPNTLINATFVSPTMTYAAEIASGGTTTGTTTSLAFNQVRAIRSTTPGCSLIAQTNNGSNNVSIYTVSDTGTITPASGSPFATGSGTQSIAWAPDGSALYVPLAVGGSSSVVTFTVSCVAGVVTVTNAGATTLTGFDLLRDAEVVGSGAGTHLCVSGTNSNNVGCFAIDSATRLPATAAVNTITVTNVRGMRIASNGCGVAGVGSAATVQGFSVASGTVTATNTAAATTNARYGAISSDGTLAAFGGFGTQFTVMSVNAACSLTVVGSNNNGISTSLVEYMVFDASNRLYVADSLANQVRVFAPTSAAVGAAISTSITNHATVNAPGGIDVILPPPPSVAPTLTYAPTEAAGVTFPAGGASAVSASIAVTAAGATGTGEAVVNGCAITGAGAASFGAVSTTPANGTFNAATTSGSIDLSCTRGPTAATASLSCTETRTPGAAVTRTWALSCPETDVPPVFAYTPAATNTVNFTGGTTVGTTGSGSIAVALDVPAGSGSGTTATTTTTCTSPTAPFTGFGQTVTATGSGAITGAPLSGSCTLGPSVETQTLTCSQNSGGVVTTLSWTLSCPVGTAVPVAPTLAYSPTEAAGVSFPAGGAGVANATISIAASGAVATGQTVLSGCAISGAGASAYGAVTTTPANGIFNVATTSGSIDLSCTRGATAATASLSCNETATPGAVTVRTWALTCPQAQANVSAGVASGSTVVLPSYSPPTGGSSTTLSFSTSGNAATVNCSAMGAGFAVSPAALNLSVGTPGTITVTYTGSTVGTFNGTLECTTTANGGPFSYPLSATVQAIPVVAVPVPLLSDWNKLLLLLAAMGCGVWFVRASEKAKT